MPLFFTKRTIFYRTITVSLLLSVSALAYVGVTRSKASAFRKTAENSSPVLAPDVEFMVNGFELNNYIDGSCSVHIKAKRLIRRGRRILAFSSNLIKDNLFEEITGRLVSKKSEVAFSSDRAEGNMEASKSLLLADNVVIKINGSQIPVKHTARINFADNTIEVDEKKQFNY